MSIIHEGMLSSFADPKDVEVFNRLFKEYKSQGLSDQQAEDKAFIKGDNGIGVWNDITSEGSGPSCAAIPEDMEQLGIGATEDNKWRPARNRRVEVTANGTTITCAIKDRLPHRKFVKHGVVLDLNPDAVRLLGKEPPLMIEGSWKLVEEAEV